MEESEKSTSLEAIGKAHQSLVLNRRLRVLAAHIGRLLPNSGAALDVGCGNGVISKLIITGRPKLSIEGLDVLARPSCAIPMQTYDGDRFPFPDDSVDSVFFVDVLHHTPDPMLPLREAKRVARRSIVIKDHLANNPVAERILALMDWIGNRPHGVVLQYNYYSSAQWEECWSELGRRPDVVQKTLGLYPWFARPFFEYGLHFVCRIPMDD